MPANRPVRVRDRTQKPICFFREPACRQGQRHRDDTTKIRNPKTPLSQGRGDISICRKYDSKKERCEAHNHALHIFLKSFYPLRPVRQRTGRRLKSYDAFPERLGFHVKRRTVLLSLSLHCKIDQVCIRAF